MGNARPCSAGERVASLALLSVLVGLCAFLVTRPPYYATEKKTPPPAKQSPGGAKQKPRDDSPPPGLLPVRIPEEAWRREGGVEIYPEDRLYEKIDGADERYKLFGTDRLLFASYVSESNPEQRIDVYCYRMKTPLAALGIFGRERPPSVTLDPDLGDAGYMVESMIAFRKGRYYVQVNGYDAEARDPCRKLASFILARIPAETAPETAFNFLPREDRIPGSERFEPKDAVLGTDFLRNVFSAEYGSAEAGTLNQPVTLFAVNCGSAEAAQRAADDYLRHLSRQGKLLQTETIEGVEATLMDLDGLFEGFCAQGEVFAGVAEAPDQLTLRKYLAALIRSLRTASVPYLGETGSKAPPPGGGR